MVKKVGALIIHPGAKPELKDISLDSDSIAAILRIKPNEVSECLIEDYCFFLPGYINGRYCIQNKEFHSSVIIVKCSSPIRRYSQLLYDENQESAESFNITEAKNALKEFGFSTVVIDRRAFPGTNLDKVSDYIAPILQCKEISFQAKGLLCLLVLHNFTLPVTGWSRFAKEEEENIQSILSELFQIGLFKNTSQEVEFVTSFFKRISEENSITEEGRDFFQETNVLYELVERESIEGEERIESKKEDEFLEPAKQLVIEKQLASVSMFQRKFQIGYTRAARLIDRLEEEGIVGPHEGSKARKVLVEKVNEKAELIEN
jgi:hypothetical protein